MSTVADYVDRKFDVLAYSGATAAGKVVLTQELVARQGGEICTGMQKLAQRFLLELFTETGSLKYQPTRGCYFMKQANGGELRTPFDVYAAFSAALVSIETNLLLDETELDPADELYASAEVLALTLAGDTVSITIKLTSQAGTSREVILPITTVPGGPHVS